MRIFYKFQNALYIEKKSKFQKLLVIKWNCITLGVDHNHLKIYLTLWVNVQGDDFINKTHTNENSFLK